MIRATVFHLYLTAFLARSRPATVQSVVQLPVSGKQNIRSVSSILLTWGLNEDSKEIRKGSLDRLAPPADVGIGIQGGFSPLRWSAFATDRTFKVWFDLVLGLRSCYGGSRVSPEWSTGRALAILACLQVLAGEVSEYKHNLLSTGDTRSSSLISSQSRHEGCVCVLCFFTRGSSGRMVP